MDVKDLRALVQGYNSKEEAIFDEIAEKFVHQVRNELESIMDRGLWADMVCYKTIGVSIKSFGRSFQSFKISIWQNWNLTPYETFDDYDDVIEFTKFMENPEWKNYSEVSGFQCENICQLQPFVNALMRKGFTCYVDTGNDELIAAFTL